MITIVEKSEAKSAAAQTSKKKSAAAQTAKTFILATSLQECPLKPCSTLGT